jgi:hypothetical protein
MTYKAHIDDILFVAKTGNTPEATARCPGRAGSSSTGVSSGALLKTRCGRATVK